MITSGEPVGAKKAVAIGLVFDAVPAERLVDEGMRRIEYLQASGEWKAQPQEAARSRSASTEDQMMFAFAVAEGCDQGEDQGPVPRAAGRAEGDPRGLQPDARGGAEGRAGGGGGARRLADLGEPDRRLLHEEPARPRPGRGRPDRQAAGRPARRRARRRPDGRGDRHGACPLGHPGRRWSTSTTTRVAGGLEAAQRRRHEPDQDRPRHARGHGRACSPCSTRRPRIESSPTATS